MAERTVKVDALEYEMRAQFIIDAYDIDPVTADDLRSRYLAQIARQYAPSWLVAHVDRLMCVGADQGFDTEG